jgi:hypothetical protein
MISVCLKVSQDKNRSLQILCEVVPTCICTYPPEIYIKDMEKESEVWGKLDVLHKSWWKVLTKKMVILWTHVPKLCSERVPFKQEEEEKEVASKRSRARPVNLINPEALQKYGLEAGDIFLTRSHKTQPRENPRITDLQTSSPSII